MYMRHCSWKPESAAQYATKHAERKSVGLCTHYVRKALITGGIPLYYAFGAATKDYKHILPLLNFEMIGDNINDVKKKPGDIIVFQSHGGRKHGHIAMWNGKQWVSDFKQRSYIVHSDYNKPGTEYSIYRRK